MQVVYGVASGLSNPQIAALLGIKTVSVKGHLQTIVRKMQLERGDRALLVATCFRRGYLAWIDDQMVVCGGVEDEDDRAREAEAHSGTVAEHDTVLPRSGTGECDRATA